MLGLTVSKTMNDTNCDLDVAVAWAISAKNSLKNVHGFSPNQSVLEEIQIFLMCVTMHYQP